MPTRRIRSTGPGRGFGLLEMVFVLAILTVLSAVAVPKYAASLTRYRTDAAARRIKAELSLARTAAKVSGSSLTVDLSEYRAILSESPYRVAIVSADFNGDEIVVFDGYGVPDSGGSVVVQAGNMRRTVVLDDETGRSEIQDPR